MRDIMTETKSERCQNKSKILTLAELEVTTCLRLTRFLTLYLTGVTSHEAFCLQCDLVLRIDLYEGAGDGKTQCLCLTLEAATVKVGFDVILLCYTQLLQRLLNHVLEDRRWEIYIDVTTVDRDCTGTFFYIHTCHCGLTTA